MTVIAVVSVLTLLVVLMGVALRLYVAHTEQTRKRSDRHYATQLAHSGIDWARGCVASRSTSCSSMLDLADATIDVTVQMKESTARIQVKARVMRNGAETSSRAESVEVPLPPPETAASSASSSPPSPIEPSVTLSPPSAPAEPLEAKQSEVPSYNVEHGVNPDRGARYRPRPPR